MPSRDVAIYAPLAAGFYNRNFRRGGGAERQTRLLALGLADRGLEVAHVTLPVRNYVPPDEPRLSVVQRGPSGGRLAEPTRIWRGLAAADARAYLLRGATPALGVAGLFCRARRRRLVFAAANDGDFTSELIESPRLGLPLYRLGVRLADAVVVQSRRQVELARDAFPEAKQVIEIPSFAETPAEGPAEPQAFLWSGRVVEYKQPLLYLDLAAAVPEARFRMIPVLTDAPEGVEDAIRHRAADLPNVELLEPRPYAETQELVREAVAIVNTSRLEGMPNVFLEGWAYGIPALSLNFDADGRIRERGLGVAAEGSWEAFAGGAEELWRRRADRGGYGPAARAYIAAEHGPDVVLERWREVLLPR